MTNAAPRDAFLLQLGRVMEESVGVEEWWRGRGYGYEERQGVEVIWSKWMGGYGRREVKRCEVFHSKVFALQNALQNSV